MRRVMLLPGLDGTGALFDSFLHAAPVGIEPIVVPLPREPLGYAALVDRLAPTLQLTQDTILIAESFSGPLAILLAQHHRIAALVLCNTFVTPPGPRALATLPWAPLLHLPLPGALVRRYLVGSDAPDPLVEKVQSTVASVPPSVLAARVSAALSADVRDNLSRCGAPLLYLRGTRDRVVSDASVQGVVSAASSPVRVVRIPGPHLLLQTFPEAAWRAIEDAVIGPQAA
jgi:pimeloyl-[acyl-carrier protein] methyl ester esterase